MKNRFNPLVQVVAALSAFTAPIQAGILYWDGNTTTPDADGGNGNWDTVLTNWDSLATAGVDTAWPSTGIDNDAVFGGIAGTVTIATGGVTANDLTFGTTGYTIGGAGLTLNGTLPVINVAGTATINSSITSAVVGGFSKTGIGTLVLGGTNSFAAGTTMVFGGSTTTAVNVGIISITNGSALSGITTITSAGAGVNVAQFQLSGGIVMSGTSVNLAGRSNFQTTGAVLVNNFGSNEWNGNFTISNAGGGYGIRSDLGLLTISGGLRSNTATRSWEVGGTGNVLISGIIGGSTGSSATSTLGFNKFGAGTVTLSAANTHGASTTINAGTLLLTNALALQNSTVDLKTADAGTLSFGSSLTTASFGALTGSRNLTLLNTNAAPAAVTLSVGNASATSYTYTGIISGGNLYKIGGGTGTFTLDPGTGVAVSINSLSANAGTMILKSGNIGTAGIDPGQTAYTMGAGARGGTLTVDGANLTIGGNRRFVVGAATAGTGNLISGSITASQVVIGHNGAATMAQSGGTVTTTNVYHQDAGSGAYTLTGGTLIAQSIYNNTANTGGTQTFTLNLNGGTLRAATGTTNLITTANIGTQISVLLGTGNTQIDTSLSNATIARPMGDMSAQVGTFTKIGANTLTLTQANTYTGATQISGGTLALTGTASIASPSIIVGASTTFDVSGVTGGYSLGSTQTISGTGSVAGAMAVSGTLSPGNSPGSISTGSQTWLNGGDFNWQMLDANGVAGTGYDTIAITGTLDLSSLTTGGFNINLWSLATIGPDVNGNAANFLGLNDYSWTLASASTAITSFNAANFFINVGSNNGTAGFSNGLDGGAFSVSQSGNNLLLNFTAIPEPDVSALLGGLGMIALLRRSRQA